jgi:hypothetical protein
LNQRLLVLSFHAPPEAAVGGLRWAGLSRNLAALGWDVRLVTGSPGAQGAADLAGVGVRVVERRITLQDHYRGWRKRQFPPRGPSGPGVIAGASTGNVRNRRGALRSGLADILSFPDHGRGWVLRAAAATRKAVLEWKPDAVVSTGPPHSVHLAAGLGLRGTGTPWIVDLRDPWVTPRHDYSGTGWRLAVNRRLEALVFRRASTILTTTPELRDVLQGHFPSAPVVWLPNGVDTSGLPARPDRLPAGLAVTHLGSVYFNRDPSPVLRAFSAFLSRCPVAAADGSVLRFVGSVSTDFRPGLERTIADLGIGPHVEITGMVARDRALGILAGSHMALVLAQGQDVMVPAKLYEAVGMGLPTLVVTEPASATGRESRRLGTAVHDPRDEAGMASTFERVWSGGWNPEGAVPARVDHAQLVCDLEEILQALVGKRPQSVAL